MNDLGYFWLMSQICRKQALEYTASTAERPKQTSNLVSRARRAVSRLLSAARVQRPQQLRDMVNKAATGTSGFIL